ncbi:hypothetical protein BKE30_01575 [Alkanindiges hydrocarboniclasticus]|uniref:Uncharacterized protein n=1 Tax=Alkanindiges hydrocarboniclasticus TaxID=1907941 RepID=A0A1S8CY69_9GAMM|nr:hypothetical protein [Alkanindiges hydrocarboniclasticus]ONG41987.1 hypothetical protein BKE30_01575 [Alkanindiges hydrocarboniclasticus]
MKLIKRGGFREQAARQLKYKNSVNQRADITAQKAYQPSHHTDEAAQDSTTPPDPVLVDNMDDVSSHSSTEHDATHKSIHKNT